MILTELNKFLNSELTTKIKKTYIEDEELSINVEIENLYSVLLFLKTDEKCRFKQLIDITAVDYPENEKRFKIIYLLLSHENNLRMQVSIKIEDEQHVPSISKIYPSANWMEREVFDMYGISFKDHPDLRRILTDYGFEGFPLRKDFPLTGHTEVRYDELEKKVIYEEVTLPQEYRNFDYLSPWEGIDNELIGDKKTKDEGEV